MSRPKPSVTSATTAPTLRGDAGPSEGGPLPGLVLAFAPRGLVVEDRAAVTSRLTVGRSSSCDWCIRDGLLSRKHFTIEPAGESRFLLRDEGSRHGLSVAGRPTSDRAEAGPGDVIRVGGSVFVVVADLWDLGPPDADRGDAEMAGRFHSPVLVQKLRVAARTGQPLLLQGETGVGKELAARALHRHYVELGRPGSFLPHNAALFAGEDDAVGILFGVAGGAFTDVAPRPGALELAEGGTFFLDELHALPLRVQRALLRFLDDGVLQPLGRTAGSKSTRSDVKLVFGTNVPVEQATEEGRLAHDLVARLLKVHIPPLRRRRADIPSIFESIVCSAVGGESAEAILESLDGALVERLCLHDYRKGNVRELVQVAVVAAARMAEGETAGEALRGAVDQVLGAAEPHAGRVPTPRPEPASSDSAGSTYEQHRQEILDVYREVGGNLSRMESSLRERGIPCTRRWLSVYLDRWGVRPIPKRK